MGKYLGTLALGLACIGIDIATHVAGYQHACVLLLVGLALTAISIKKIDDSITETIG